MFEKSVIWYKNLNFSHKKCDRDRDAGMGRKKGTLPGKWGNEPQISFLMMTNGREHFPWHLSGLLCEDNSTRLARTVPQLFLSHIPEWPYEFCTAVHLSSACYHYCILKMPTSHSHIPVLSSFILTTTKWRVQPGIGTTIIPHSLVRRNKYLFSYQQHDLSPPSLLNITSESLCFSLDKLSSLY